MKNNFKQIVTTLLNEKIGNIINDQLDRLYAINRKYSNPKITMTPTVRWALLALRLYILFLVGILFYKFFTWP
ncbi:MAG: hypothetical protein HQK53_05230 [Oligoflexia bacterium]|nr:hypothetical protein [Oligoflexia bacterium]